MTRAASEKAPNLHIASTAGNQDAPKRVTMRKILCSWETTICEELPIGS
jgi:hypothetical protein